jgi:alanyl-tRNA synthetase
VLLTTAGMQQMIPYMLGREQAPAARMTSIQKCFRTGDIDEVGNPRNLTFFEMMGNFSIGDYFKRDAIAWAWEFVTEWLRFPPERVYITVHPTDDEAHRLWLDIGIPPERISFLEDNWWGPPGAEGPCGPDSELYFDRGPEYGDGVPGSEGDRFLEFWNLVFMEFYQARDGSRTPLPRQCVDTGCGLDRVAALLQDVPTVYETDLFQPILDRVAEVSGVRYGESERGDYALRVIADHGRGMTFLAADGVTPGNEGRGYVMRRIIRRAVRYGRLLGVDRPFLESVVQRVIERMGEGSRPAYPELAERRAAILDTIRHEERRFAETLSAGTERLAEWIDQARAAGANTVDGRLLFQLHDTFGFPLELSEEILSEAGMAADRAGFELAMAEQRARGRAGARFAGVAELETYDVGEVPPTSFIGYQSLVGTSRVVGLHAESGAVDHLGEGDRGLLLLASTPFYAEGGGQVGDGGEIRTPEGIFVVEETRRLDERHVGHFGRVRVGTIRVGDSAEASVERSTRMAAARHHTLTHILHRVLKDTLGAATEQKGSLVSPSVARFDFNFARGLTADELAHVNREINRRILDDMPVAWRVTDIESARRAGAVAIFGEKYSDKVRMVDIGGWSRELCGGTHLARTSQVGPAIVLRESALASGIRRIEVVAGEPAVRHAWTQHERLLNLARSVGAPVDQLEAKVQQLADSADAARRELTRATQQLAARRADQLVDTAVDVDGVRVLAARVEAADRDSLRDMADQLRNKLGSSVVALAADLGGQFAFVVGVSKEAGGRGINASDVLRASLAPVGGKGGGRPDLAQGGVNAVDQLEPALGGVLGAVRRVLQKE